MLINIVEEIQAWPFIDGWHVSPLGNRVRLGNDVTLGDGVTLGDCVTLGNDVTLGDGVTLAETPIYVMGATPYWFGYCGRPGYLSSGCIEESVEYWLEHVEACAAHHGYTEGQQAAARSVVECVVAWMKLRGVDKPVKGDDDDGDKHASCAASD